MYISFNMNSEKEFCRNNIVIEVYDEKFYKVCEINDLYDKKHKNILNYKIDPSEVIRLFCFEINNIDDVLKEEIRKRKEEEKLFENSKINKEKIEKKYLII